MGDFYILFCVDLTNGNEYYIIVTEGFVFKYLEINKNNNNNDHLTAFDPGQPG